MENSKQPAFAVSKEMCEASEITEYPYGLTKREYFAAKALQGLMVQAIAGNHNLNTKQWNDERARFAVDMADAVLSALEKQNGA